jgi:hypothetical protein
MDHLFLLSLLYIYKKKEKYTFFKNIFVDLVGLEPTTC